MALDSSHSSKTTSSLESFFYYSLAFSATALYCLIIYQHAYNMPKWDDYMEVLDFMARWLAAETPTEKFQAFISHTNEHILLVNHSFILWVYYYLGEINFRSLIFIGNLFFISTALLLFLCLETISKETVLKNSWSHSQPTANNYRSHTAFRFCLLFLIAINFYPYDSLLWAMTAISNQAVITFTLAACLLAYKANLVQTATKTQTSTQAFLLYGLAALCCLLATFSQSNGLLAALAVNALIYWQYRQQKITARALILWSAFSVATFVLYFSWFNPISHQNATSDDLWQLLSFDKILLMPASFVALLGGIVFSEAGIAQLISAFVIGLLLLTLAFKLYRRQPPSMLMVIITGFLLLSLLLITFGRSIYIGPAVAVTSRYKMYALYLLICAIVFMPACLSYISANRKRRIVAIGIALLFHLYAYAANLAHSRLIDGHLHESLLHWTEDGDLRRAKGHFIHDADSYLFTAVNNGAYNPRLLLEPEDQLHIKTLSNCPTSALQPQAPISAPAPKVSISHINRNAVVIKIVLHEAVDKLWLCASDHVGAYQIAIPPQPKINHAYYVGREDINPGYYQLLSLQQDKIHQESKVFHKKNNIR